MGKCITFFLIYKHNTIFIFTFAIYKLYFSNGKSLHMKRILITMNYFLN